MTGGMAPRRAARLDLAALAISLMLGLGLVVWVFGQRQQDPDRAPLGMDGLQIWLAKGGVSAQVFSGGWWLDPATIGLLLVPLTDTMPDAAQAEPTSPKELLFQSDQLDIDWPDLETKLAQVPALVVLPKWRRGVGLIGKAHPALLVDGFRLEAILRRLTGLSGIRLQRQMDPAFTRLGVPDPGGAALSAELYLAQLARLPGCIPLMGTRTATLLASCPLKGQSRRVLVLTDPDLLNNHGLRLGQNALIARSFLASRAGQRLLVIDESPQNWLARLDAPLRRERTWADLARFLQPPFLALWLGAGGLLALALWRSLWRAGPERRPEAVPVWQPLAARARLMRRTGQDGALLADYAAARIAAVAAGLVGPALARQIAEPAAFVRHIARRRADLAARLEAQLAALAAAPRSLAEGAARRHLDALDQILEDIAHDT